jgi:hypothetical protein
MDLSAFSWSIDNPTFTQFGFTFMGTVITLSTEMLHVMNQPFQPRIDRVVLYLSPCDDVPILDRLALPVELVPIKPLSPGDIFMAISTYYNKPIELSELQRLSTLGSNRARSNLGSSGTLIMDPSVCRRNLMGTRLRFRGLTPYGDGYIVRIE